DGILDGNDGDWVESLSALVETHAGELKIIHWPHRAKKQKGAPQLAESIDTVS
ncbi:MAG: hypothetical protein RJA17_505, partial [Pseudomonadota bacterium]